MYTSNRAALVLAIGTVLTGTPLIAATASLTLGGEQAMVAAQQASPEFARQDGERLAWQQKGAVPVTSGELARTRAAGEKYAANAAEPVREFVTADAAAKTRSQASGRSRAQINWESNQSGARTVDETRAHVLERVMPSKIGTGNDAPETGGASPGLNEESRSRALISELR